MLLTRQIQYHSLLPATALNIFDLDGRTAATDTSHMESTNELLKRLLLSTSYSAVPRILLTVPNPVLYFVHNNAPSR